MGNSIDWTTAYLLMFENGCFRGGSVHPNGFRNGGYPDLIGNADAGEAKTGQDRLNEYIAVAEMLGVKIAKGSVNAKYAWLTFAYTMPPTNADMANNVLGTTVLQSFKFCFGNDVNNTWNTLGNVNNGLGFTMGGLQTSASNALSRTMAYYSTASKIKPPQTMFKVPGGSVYISTKAVSTASKVLRVGE